MKKSIASAPFPCSKVSKNRVAIRSGVCTSSQLASVGRQAEKINMSTNCFISPHNKFLHSEIHLPMRAIHTLTHTQRLERNSLCPPSKSANVQAELAKQRCEMPANNKSFYSFFCANPNTSSCFALSGSIRRRRIPATSRPTAANVLIHLSSAAINDIRAPRDPRMIHTQPTTRRAPLNTRRYLSSSVITC
jgi:hypothetical protein